MIQEFFRFKKIIDIPNCNSLILSPDNKYLMAGTDQEIQFLSASSFQKQHILDAKLEEQVHILANSKCGRLFASGNYDASVKVWDQISKTNVKSFFGHSLLISCLDFSHSSKYLASGSYDGLINVWELTKMILSHQINVQDMVSCLKYTPDDKHIVAGRYEKKIQIYRTTDNQLFQEINQVLNQQNSLDFSKKRKLMISVDKGLISIFNSENFQSKNSIYDVNNHSDSRIVISPDEQFLILINNQKDYFLTTVYNLDNFQTVFQNYRQEGNLQMNCFSQDGKQHFYLNITNAGSQIVVEDCSNLINYQFINSQNVQNQQVNNFKIDDLLQYILDLQEIIEQNKNIYKNDQQVQKKTLIESSMIEIIKLLNIQLPQFNETNKILQGQIQDLQSIINFEQEQSQFNKQNFQTINKRIDLQEIEKKQYLHKIGEQENEIQQLKQQNQQNKEFLNRTRQESDQQLSKLQEQKNLEVKLEIQNNFVNQLQSEILQLKLNFQNEQNQTQINKVQSDNQRIINQELEEKIEIVDIQNQKLRELLAGQTVQFQKVMDAKTQVDTEDKQIIIDQKYQIDQLTLQLQIQRQQSINLQQLMDQQKKQSQEPELNQMFQEKIIQKENILKQQILNLENKVSELNANLQQEKNQGIICQEQLEVCQNQHLQSIQKVQMVENDKTQLNQKIMNQNNSLLDFKKFYDQMNQNIQVFNQQKQELQIEKQNLQIENESLQQQNNNLCLKLNQNQQDKNELQNMLQQLSQNSTLQIDQIKDQQKIIELNNLQISQLLDQIKSQQKLLEENSQQKQGNKYLQQEIIDLQKQLLLLSQNKIKEYSDVSILQNQNQFNQNLCQDFMANNQSFEISFLSPDDFKHNQKTKDVNQEKKLFQMIQIDDHQISNSNKEKKFDFEQQLASINEANNQQKNNLRISIQNQKNE